MVPGEVFMWFHNDAHSCCSIFCSPNFVANRICEKISERFGQVHLAMVSVEMQCLVWVGWDWCARAMLQKNLIFNRNIHLLAEWLLYGSHLYFHKNYMLETHSHVKIAHDSYLALEKWWLLNRAYFTSLVSPPYYCWQVDNRRLSLDMPASAIVMKNRDKSRYDSALMPLGSIVLRCHLGGCYLNC